MKVLFNRILIVLVAAILMITLSFSVIQAEEIAEGEWTAEELCEELSDPEVPGEIPASDETVVSEESNNGEMEPAEENDPILNEDVLSGEEIAQEEITDGLTENNPDDLTAQEQQAEEPATVSEETEIPGNIEIEETGTMEPGAAEPEGTEPDTEESETTAQETGEIVFEQVSEVIEDSEYVIEAETVAEILNAEESLILTETFSDSAEGWEATNMSSEDMLEGFVTIEALYSSSYNGNKLSDLTELVYNDLKEMVTKVAAGSLSSTKYTHELTETELSSYRWTAVDLGVSSLFADESRTKINEQAAEIAFDSIYNPSLAVKSLIRDCPYELFWFGNKYNLFKTKIAVVEYDSTIKDYVLYFAPVDAKGNPSSLTINLQVSNDYAGTDIFTVNQAKVENAKKAVINANKIVSDAAGKSDLEKLDYYRQQICNLVSYNKTVTSANYSGGYGDPWQMIYVFDGNTGTNVVCEGYAKAFQYLCDLSLFSTSDFAVYSVSGTFKAGSGKEGGHLWNIVRMNGINYMVDLTNSDDTTPTTKLYMVHPESGSVDSGYIFRAGSVTYTYKYHDDTKLLYTESELSYNIVHEWDNGKIVAQPTCTSAGSKLYTCKLCNATRSETIPAKGHTAVVYSPAVQETLFNEGKTAGTSCSVCKAIVNAPQTIARQELTRQLYIGATGDDVKQVQQRLRDLGYSIYVDGDYGQVTASVVKQFQSDYGLYADGLVGTITLNALRNAMASTHYSDNVTLTRELSVGMNGDDVRAVQQKLASLGYSIVVDGDFGYYTKSVVETFQTAHGLYVDGVVGPKTMEVLNSLTSSSGNSGNSSSSGTINLTRDLKLGMTGADVMAVQQRLADLGYSIYVDGDFGSKTEQVVKAFQQAKGLYVDGLVGGQTLKALNAQTGSSSSGKITLTRELKKGLNGQDVKTMQQKLADLGYSIYVDGDFGAVTEQVVIAFQQDHGLYADGIVGNVTANALNSL